MDDGRRTREGRDGKLTMKQKERKGRDGGTANGQRKEGTNEREKVEEAQENQERNGEGY